MNTTLTVYRSSSVPTHVTMRDWDNDVHISVDSHKELRIQVSGDDVDSRGFSQVDLREFCKAVLEMLEG